MDAMSNTCAGACCAVFPMHLGQAPFRRKGELSAENEYILDMLIPLTRRQALARSRRLGYPDPPKWASHKYGLFTCRHWDEETRLCGAYESRPAMCRDYPYGRPCERGCSYQVERLNGVAKAEDSTWVWDVAANGWRPTSNSAFLWDPETGVLRTIPEEPPT
jgi:Fe-S-cluster containining protein